ncbi:MAG: hypothetical protein HN353_10105 [Bdellovibrionales bacterium]|jgi:hypothetical protein|nr:hypothetical protein [Bdellovibrionales bacterium]MBT3527253.1 hypothetical protein [Bdellovibrionales bacterium]MBT7668404.1 hypothetical protein [Bdellovibrionales bacterium]MBT7767890.1 hypothetical protein [Bdellovibrionales bacterium]
MTEDLPIYSRGMFRPRGEATLPQSFSSRGPLGSVDLFLGEILKAGAENYSISQIKTALAHDLKEVLALDDLDTMIRSIFHIEQQLNHLAGQLGEEDEFDRKQFPNLTSLFAQLAPLLLRVILDNSATRTSRGEIPRDSSIFHECKEAVRIALEREIF